MRHAARDAHSRETRQVLRYTVVGTILICGVGFGDAVLRPSPPPPSRRSHPPSRAPLEPRGASLSPRLRTPKSTTLVLSRRGGGHAGCVLVQSAASREFVVGTGGGHGR